MSTSVPTTSLSSKQDNLSPVVWKLSLFTLLMIVGPIGTYFLSLNHYFHDPTPSAISAAFVANLVLVGFVVVAILEDSGPEHPTTPAAGLGQIGEEKMDAVSREKMRVGKKE